MKNYQMFRLRYIRYEIKEDKYFLLQYSLYQQQLQTSPTLILIKMQATLFSTFGLLLVLMMKKQNKIYSISRQIDIVIAPQISHNRPVEYQQEMEEVTPQKKKKAKKNKKTNKNGGHSRVLYPRHSLDRQVMEMEWRKKEQQKRIKCQLVGKQIDSLIAYFCEDLQIKIPYNGITGVYSINIIIPGSIYSDVPIQIKFTQAYPFQLAEINIQTHNLHPLQKQKLFDIIKQQRSLFVKAQQQFIGEGNEEQTKTSQAWEKQQNKNLQYLYSYYQYAFNLCVAISQQLFYNIGQVVQQQQNLNVGRNKVGRMEEQVVPHSNAALLEKIEINKQIYQNILEEIFTRYDNQQVNPQKPLPFQDNNAIKHPNLRGRYLLDYEELQMIGEGGFGSVYRCRNRVDSNIYAVKKMVINYNDTQSRKLLKQVALLSKLNHPNIVRYHQSWLEDTSSVEQLIADMSITDPEEIQEFKKIWKQYSIDHPISDKQFGSNQHLEEEEDSSDNSGEGFQIRSEEDSVIFGDDIIFDRDYSSYADFNQGKQKQKTKKHMNMFQNLQYDQQTSQPRKRSKSRKHSQIYEFPFKILYIVMQYCGSMTLKDFINKKFQQKKDVKVKLIRGILQGLSYIHSRRIIHRDLKPANIFLIDNTNKVKIGDFGVATIGNIQHNPYQAEITQYSEKTKGVGTSYYRAPQQFSSSQYDEKIDIYSLGIIMFEIFFKFETMMQRSQILTQITKTHKLPKQFNKFEHNYEFQEQIQSCISAKPGDRPTVQKLLQTFRNKYFTQLVSLIANPKHFQFYQLMNHLFEIKNESSLLMKQNLFKNYLTYAFTKIFQIHRGVHFTPLSLIPVADIETINGVQIQSNRKQKFLLLSQRGVVMEYPSNAYVSWIRYARETIKRNYKTQPHNHFKQDIIQTNKEMRRFTFEKVAEFVGGDLKSQFSFKQKYVTAFDIVYPFQNQIKPFFLCEVLKISLLMIDTMQLTQKSPPIYLCHSLIFKCLAIKFNIPILNLYRFIVSISDQKFRSLKNQTKIDYLKTFGIQVNISKKIINMMQIQFENDLSFMNYCKYGNVNNQVDFYKQDIQAIQLLTLYQSIQDQIKSIVECLEIFNINQRVRWKLQIPSPNTFGFFWNAGPIKGFTSIQQYFNGQNLCNLHLQTSLNPSSEENQADVSIWSNGQFLEKDIMQTVAKCWKNNITAKWYDQSLGEKDLTCRYNIILKKKYDRVYLMLRKNLFGFDRILQKKNSQGADKQVQKQTSFILKEHFNFQVLKMEIKENNRKIANAH